MATGALTTRATQLNTSVLARLAERWRPVGLYLACLDKEGNLVWHDSQMPRVLALCLTADATLAPQARKLAEGATFASTRLQGQLPWVHLQLMPVARRRKLSGWVVMLGRTEAVSPACEDLARMAQRASLDGGALLAQAQRVPLVPAASFAALARVAEQMHEDLHTAATANTELANVTEQLTSVYEEISLLYKISSGMRFSQKSQTFLETVCREVQGIGNYRAVLVSLVSRSGVD
jgi:hypothetical protein